MIFKFLFLILFLKFNACIQCGERQYLSNGVCYHCPSFCQTCLSNSVCTKCVLGYGGKACETDLGLALGLPAGSLVLVLFIIGIIYKKCCPHLQQKNNVNPSRGG